MEKIIFKTIGTIVSFKMTFFIPTIIVTNILTTLGIIVIVVGAIAAGAGIIIGLAPMDI